MSCGIWGQRSAARSGVQAELLRPQPRALERSAELRDVPAAAGVVPGPAPHSLPAGRAPPLRAKQCLVLPTQMHLLGLRIWVRVTLSLSCCFSRCDSEVR